jgi:hypothetical protein
MMTEQPGVLVETGVGWQIGVQTEVAKSRLVIVFCREGLIAFGRSPFRAGA